MATKWRDPKSVRKWKSRDRAEARFYDMKDNEQPVDVLYPSNRFNSTRDDEFRLFMRRYFENEGSEDYLNEWHERFMKYSPEQLRNSMDAQAVKVYRGVLKDVDDKWSANYEYEFKKRKGAKLM